MTNFHVAKKPRNLPCSGVEVKRITRKRTRMHVTVGCARRVRRTLSPAMRPYHHHRLRLNVQLLAAVKPTSTTINRFAGAIIAQT